MKLSARVLLIALFGTSVGGCHLLFGIEEPFIDEQPGGALPDLIAESVSVRGDEVILRFCNVGGGAPGSPQFETEISADAPGAVAASRFAEVPGPSDCSEAIVPCDELAIDCREALRLGAVLDVTGAIDESSETNNDLTDQSGGVARVFILGDGVFSTSLGSALEGDILCQSTADFQGLEGQWSAWLSDGFIDVATRFRAPGAVLERIDGTVVIEDMDDLFDGAPLQNPIDHDETGTMVDPGGCVFTGTLPSGDASGADCGNWSGQGETVTVGTIGSLDGNWTTAMDTNCDQTCTIYCFEERQFLSADPLPDVFISQVVRSQTDYEITVCNGGETPPFAVNVDVHIQNAFTSLAVLAGPVAIPDAAACAVVSTPCDSLGDPSCFDFAHVVVSADPLDEIIEADERNNLFVVDLEGGA